MTTMMHQHVLALLDAGHEVRLERWEEDGEQPRYWAHVTAPGGSSPHTAEGKTPAEALWAASPLHGEGEPYPDADRLTARAVRAVYDDGYDHGQSDMAATVAALEERVSALEAKPQADGSPATDWGVIDPCGDVTCQHAKESHWEHGEPGGPRQGCAILGCECMAYMAAAS